MSWATVSFFYSKVSFIISFWVVCCRTQLGILGEFLWPRVSWVTALDSTDILLSQPLGLMGAIKEKTQAIKCSSCEPNCMCGTLGDDSDTNENMIDHMWGN